MEARSARFIGFCTQAMSVTESACDRWSRVTLLRPTPPISPLSRAFTMVASNRWSGSASSIRRKFDRSEMADCQAAQVVLDSLPELGRLVVPQHSARLVPARSNLADQGETLGVG